MENLRIGSKLFLCFMLKNSDGTVSNSFGLYLILKIWEIYEQCSNSVNFLCFFNFARNWLVPFSGFKSSTFMHSLASKIDNPLIWNVTSEPGVNSIFVMLKLYQLRHEVNIPHIWILCPVGILLPFPLKFSEIKLDYFDLPCLDLEFYAQWKLGPNMKLYITYVYIVNCTMHIALYILHYIHQTMHIAVYTLHHAHCTMPIALWIL